MLRERERWECSETIRGDFGGASKRKRGAKQPGKQVAMTTLHNIKQRRGLARLLHLPIPPSPQQPLRHPSHLVLHHRRPERPHQVQPRCGRENVPQRRVHVRPLRCPSVHPQGSAYQPEHRSVVETDLPGAQEVLSHCPEGGRFGEDRCADPHEGRALGDRGLSGDFVG